MTATITPLAEALARAREQTIELVGLVEDADLNRSLNAEFSPLRWHLGHIAAYEAFWVLVQAGGHPSLKPEFDHLFDPTRNPKANRVHLPARSEILDFSRRVREQVLTVLSDCAPDHPNPLLRDGFVGNLVYEHECQHQEILTFLLQMIPPERKRRPDMMEPDSQNVEPSGEMVAVPAGPFVLGTTGRVFAYDNERDRHEVVLDAYRIDRTPVTERAFSRFVEAGGYRDERLWSADGWRWRVENDINAPRDWIPTEAGGWRVRTMFAERDLRDGVPVVGVSHYEAEAYARLLGRRLPTEAEWELRRSVGHRGRSGANLPLGRCPARSGQGQHGRASLGHTVHPERRPESRRVRRHGRTGLGMDRLGLRPVSRLRGLSL